MRIRIEVLRAVVEGREVWWVVVGGGIVGVYENEREARKVARKVRKIAKA